MDAHFLSEAVKDNISDSVNEMINLFRTLAPANNQIYTDALDRLVAAQAPQRNQIDAAAEEFTFAIPQHTYETMIARLDHTPLREGTHYKEVNHNTFINTNLNCFLTAAPQFLATRARTQFLAAHPAATVEQQQAEYDRVLALRTTFNETTALEAPVWEIMQRQGNNDIRQEDSLLIFLDTSRKQPHWYKIIHNLKAYGEQSGYTLNHYKRCLDRFVGFFAPHLSPVTDNLEPVDLAKFLLKLTMPEPTKDRLTQQLASLTRQPNTPLRFVINELLAIAKVYYHENTPEEREVLINRLMILGLTQFTTGETSKHLKSTVEYAAAYNKQLDWKKLLDSTTYSERVNGTPQHSLSFKPPSGTSLSLFHSELLPLDMPEFLPPNPVEDPIQYAHDTHDKPHRSHYSHKSSNHATRPPQPQPVMPVAPQIVAQPAQNYRPHRTPPPPPPQRRTPPPAPKSKKTKRARETNPPSTPPSPSTSRSTRSKNKKLPLNQVYTNSKSPQSSQPSSANTSRSNSQTSRSSWTSRSRSQSPYQKPQNAYNKSRSKQHSTNKTHTSRSQQNAKNSKYPQQSYKSRSQSPYNRQQSRSPYKNDKNKRYNNASNDRNKRYKTDKYKQSNNRNYSQSPHKNSNYSKSRNYSSSRPQSRSQSPANRQQQFPGFLPGVNCSPDYLPWISKNCKKCSTYADHHECYCPQYYRFNQSKCSTCRTGYHMPSECKSQKSLSPARPQNYNVSLN